MSIATTTTGRTEYRTTEQEFMALLGDALADVEEVEPGTEKWTVRGISVYLTPSSALETWTDEEVVYREYSIGRFGLISVTDEETGQHVLGVRQ